MTTYSTDPALYIFTSLTAGSSHIVTATSRLETILRANRIPFKAVDIAVDDKARMLWGRRAGKDDAGRQRKLPGLVQEGFVVGDLVEIEDWNEYGELKQHVKIYYDEHTIPNIHNKPPEPKKTQKPAAKPAVPTNTNESKSKSAPAPAPLPAAPPLPSPKPSSDATTPKTPADGPPHPAKQTVLPIRSVADEAAQKAKELRLKSLREKVHGTKSSSPADEKQPSRADKPSNKDQKPPGLQSPTSGTWKSSPGSDAALESVQSPRTGSWRPGSLVGAVVGMEKPEIQSAEKSSCPAEGGGDDGAAKNGKDHATKDHDVGRDGGEEEKKAEAKPAGEEKTGNAETK